MSLQKVEDHLSFNYNFLLMVEGIDYYVIINHSATVKYVFKLVDQFKNVIDVLVVPKIIHPNL